MSGQEDLVRMAQEIDEHLSRVRQALRKPLETEIARGGLTGQQRGVMQALVRSDGMSLRDLSRGMGLAHSTVAGIVDRMVKKGLVERRPSKDDRHFSVIPPFQTGARPRAKHVPKFDHPSLGGGAAPHQAGGTGRDSRWSADITARRRAGVIDSPLPCEDESPAQALLSGCRRRSSQRRRPSQA
jgi:hypothetical protein